MTEFAIADVEGVSVNKSMTVFAAPDQTNRVRVTMGSVVEMLLKDRNQLNLPCDENHQGDLVPILLAVAVVGFVTYGVAATAIINGLYQASGFWLPHSPAAHWNSPSAANLTLGYALGLIAANGICLPKASISTGSGRGQISMVGISAHALKGMAAAAPCARGAVADLCGGRTFRDRLSARELLGCPYRSARSGTPIYRRACRCGESVRRIRDTCRHSARTSAVLPSMFPPAANAGLVHVSPRLSLRWSSIRCGIFCPI